MDGEVCSSSEHPLLGNPSSSYRTVSATDEDLETAVDCTLLGKCLGSHPGRKHTGNPLESSSTEELRNSPGSYLTVGVGWETNKGFQPGPWYTKTVFSRIAGTANTGVNQQADLTPRDDESPCRLKRKWLRSEYTNACNKGKWKRY